MGVGHVYEPDFLVGLADGRTLVLEIKGQETDREHAKHQAAQRWVSAVNHWGDQGQWVFHVCRDPQSLRTELRFIVSHAGGRAIGGDTSAQGEEPNVPHKRR